MSKRVAVAVMGATSGVLLLTGAETAPLGGLLLAGALYLAALPHVDGGRAGVDRTPERRRGR